jgi:hypothetical protein
MAVSLYWKKKKAGGKLELPTKTIFEKTPEEEVTMTQKSGPPLRPLSPLATPLKQRVYKPPPKLR